MDIETANDILEAIEDSEYYEIALHHETIRELIKLAKATTERINNMPIDWVSVRFDRTVNKL